MSYNRTYLENIIETLTGRKDYDITYRNRKVIVKLHNGKTIVYEMNLEKGDEYIETIFRIRDDLNIIIPLEDLKI